MSATLRHYIGGQIALMPELTALYWPTINSYKRSVENTWAPTTATWGLENRTCAIRVIGDDPKSTRVEYRQLGADMNPYIGMAVSLAAGLWGIEHQVEPPPPCAGNGYARPRPRRRCRAACKDARRAPEALRGRARAPRRRVRRSLRPHARVGGAPVRARRHDWELERYLEII